MSKQSTPAARRARAEVTRVVRRTLTPLERVLVAVIYQSGFVSAGQAHLVLSRLDPKCLATLGGVPLVCDVERALSGLALADFVVHVEDGSWALTLRLKEVLELGQVVTGSLSEVLHG